MKVRFVIPIRHPDGVADRAKQLAELRQTLASIAAQSSTEWTATIVVNPAQVLPEIPERTRVRHVDLPPNTALAAARDREELMTALQLDKGQRVAAGLDDVEADDLVMVVDDDDLIHRDLVAFVASKPRCGWVIGKGYWWRSGSRVLERTERFNDRCGTSLLVPPHYYGHFAGGVSESDAIRELASHKRIFDRLPKQAPAWRPVPFPAGIYRLQGRGTSRLQIAASAVGAPVPRPPGLRTRLAALRRLRLMTRAVRRDFFGAA